MKLRFINFGIVDPSKAIPGKASRVTGVHYWMDKSNPLLVSAVINTPTLVGSSAESDISKYADMSKGGDIQNAALNADRVVSAQGFAVLTNSIVFRFYYPKYSLLRNINENIFARSCFLNAIADTIELLNPNLKVSPNTSWSIAIDDVTIGSYIINAIGHSCLFHLTFDNILTQAVLKDDPYTQCQRQVQSGVKDILPNVTADTIFAILPPKFAEYLGIPFEVSEVLESERGRYNEVAAGGIEIKEVPMAENLAYYSSAEIPPVEDERGTK